MNRLLFLASVMVMYKTDGVCGYRKIHQIKCLKSQHQHQGISWGPILVKKAEKRADKRYSTIIQEGPPDNLVSQKKAKYYAYYYKFLAGNISHTCSDYIQVKGDKLAQFKGKHAKVGCAISRDINWIAVYCIYQVYELN